MIEPSVKDLVTCLEKAGMLRTGFDEPDHKCDANVNASRNV